jgi:hypothetical protein
MKAGEDLRFHGKQTSWCTCSTAPGTVAVLAFQHPFVFDHVRNVRGSHSSGLFRTRNGRTMQFGRQGHRNDEIQWSEKLWQIACSLQWYKPILGYVESSWHFASCHALVCLTPGYSASPPDLQGMFYIHSDLNCPRMLLLALLAGSRSPGGVCEADCFRAGSLHLHPSQREQSQSEDHLISALFSSCSEFLQQVAEKDCWWEWWQPCSLLSLYHLQILIADHARMWYVHLNYNLLSHAVHPGSRTNLNLFDWRYICYPTYVTAIGHCSHRIPYLFIEDTSVVHDYMIIWWIAQPLITKFCFYDNLTYLNCDQNNEPSVNTKWIDESLKAKSATAERESIVQFSRFYGTG